MTNERTIAPGAPVGWRGWWAKVIQVHPHKPVVRLLYKPTGATRHRQSNWVAIRELTDPPPPPEHVTEAGIALSALFTREGQQAVLKGERS